MDRDYLWGDWGDDLKYDIYSQKYGRVPVSKTKETQPKEAKMSKLYEIQVSDKKLYGHKLAVNSQGHWVMEVKGTGEVLAVDKQYVEEVMPHTIGVQFETSKTTYHYLAEAGKYSVGDFFVVDAPMGRAIVNVVSVDTKSQMATKHFSPLAKLVTE